jgi:hypothetical protein
LHAFSGPNLFIYALPERHTVDLGGAGFDIDLHLPGRIRQIKQRNIVFPGFRQHRCPNGARSIPTDLSGSKILLLQPQQVFLLEQL